MKKVKKFWLNTMSIFQHSKSELEKIDLKECTLYRSIFKYLNSNMYIIMEGKEAIVIDPNPNDYVISLLKDNNIESVSIILTHEHRDHIYGIYLFQENFKTQIISTTACADYISREENSRPIIIFYVLEEIDKSTGSNLVEAFNKEYVPRTYNPDITFDEKYSMVWNTHNLEFFNILGHSRGSCAIIIDGNYVFTGDTLLKEYPVITRFPGGNTKIFKNITLPLLENKLNSDMLVFPGHGAPFILKEIMKDGKIDVELK